VLLFNSGLLSEKIYIQSSCAVIHFIYVKLKSSKHFSILKLYADGCSCCYPVKQRQKHREVTHDHVKYTCACIGKLLIEAIEYELVTALFYAGVCIFDYIT